MVKSKIVRDKITLVGKGAGLLQFENENGVEEALKLNGQVWKDKKLQIYRSKYAIPQ